MKHFYLRTFILCLLATMGAKASAHDIEVKNDDGVTIYYNKINNYELEVTCRGSSYSLYTDEYIGIVVIPKEVTYEGKTYGVTSIGNYAFHGCTDFAFVTIPNSVTSIGNFSFYGCTGLTTVTIPNSVTSIGNYAFSRCTGLKSIAIPSSVTNIGNDAFSRCTGLTSVTLDNSLTSIGSSAFADCTGLTSVIIPNSVKRIGNCAFSNCTSLTSILVDSLNATYDSRDNCNAIIETNTNTLVLGIKGSVIPSSVTCIGDYAFYCCTCLTSVTIPNSVTTIGRSAFYNCTGLTSVTIPNSVTSIGSSAFYGCTCLTSVTIPNSVTTIGDGSFRNCTGLTSVTIPNSVTSIGSSAFSKCTGLTSVTIPNSVTSIGTSTFSDCTGLASVTIPNSVTSIGSSAFYGCTCLTSVTIPNSVTTIGDGSFRNCTGLTNVMLDNNFLMSQNRNSSSSLKGIFGSQVKEYVIGESVKSIGSSAFSNCTGLTSVTIPNTVTTIGSSAFYCCKGLTSMTIPSSVVSIEIGAFDGCTGLTLVTLESNTLVSDNWSSSKSMKNVFGDQVKQYVLGDSVTSIGSYVFFGCKNLTTVIFPNYVTKIGSKALPSNSYIYVNAGTTSLLTLWNAGYDAYQLGTNNEHICPYLEFNTTQTTYTCQLKDKMEGYTYKIVKDGVEQEEAFTVTGLYPDCSERATLTILKDEASYSQEFEVKTKYIAPSIVVVSQTSSSLACKGTYIDGDATVTSQSLQIEGKTFEGIIGNLTGLDPNRSYRVSYTINVPWGENLENSQSYTKTMTITTKELSLSTLQPKVISAGNVIVAAESNLDDAETNVGFEWRRTDWTDDFASNTGGAVLFDGTMEGYIRNLYTEKLWKYRPYYESNSAQRYYGEWVGIDPTNTSYFEPTVHTYAQVSVVDNTALVKGYAMRGTDNVAEQGFKYWKLSAQARGAVNSTEVPADAITVKANGQVMTAQLTDLDYETDYCYVAFVTTNEGETFYGEQQSFKTGVNTSGVHDATIKADVTEVVRYDLRGRRIDSPQKGMNIVLMSDGSTRKVYVK